MPRDVPGLEHVLQGHTALTELDLSCERPIFRCLRQLRRVASHVVAGGGGRTDNLLRHEGTRLVIAALKGASALVRLNLAGASPRGCIRRVDATHTHTLASTLMRALRQEMTWVKLGARR
jgi:hypothetical protein